MIHYGESASICGTFKATDDITDTIHRITCPGCLFEVYRATDENDSGYYERDEHEYVPHKYTDAYVMFLRKSMQCAVRGVFVIESGQVYTFTIRRPGQADIRGHRFIATHMKYPIGTALDIAEDLFRIERQFMTEADLTSYRRQREATYDREMRDATAQLLVTLDPSI